MEGRKEVQWSRTSANMKSNRKMRRSRRSYVTDDDDHESEEKMNQYSEKTLRAPSVMMRRRFDHDRRLEPAERDVGPRLPVDNMEAESSILVSKHPNYALPSGRFEPGRAGGVVSKGSKMLPDPPDVELVHAKKSNAEGLDLNELMAKPRSEFQNYVSRMKQPSLLLLCYELADYARKLEDEGDVREEVLDKLRKQLDHKSRGIHERDAEIRRLEKELVRVEEVEEMESVDGDFNAPSSSNLIRCRFTDAGCAFKLRSMEQHEENECKYRPARCPSLTCPIQPPFATVLDHIKEDHSGTKKGKDRVCRNSSSHLVSSYVNIDKEPIFYKTTKMTWVANELVLDNHHFYLECMRIPPDWHLWVYFLGTETDAANYQVTITLFKEYEYGRVGEDGFTAQRSYTGPVISIQRSKEEIAEYGLGFMIHDKQVRGLCGPISNSQEQLFGYEVTVYRKNK